MIKNKKKLFTEYASREEGNEIGHFIRSKGYDGVQNDSYRYCDMMITMALERVNRHSNEVAYIGTNRGRMVVGTCKRRFRGNGMTFIEKKRKFFELLDEC